jgi:hypothetical protein
MPIASGSAPTPGRRSRLGVPILDLEVDDDPWVLAAATYGRGAWRLDFETVPLFRDGLESGAIDRWLP